MSIEFDVSFQKAIGGVMEVNARMSGLGRKVDELERKGKKLESGYQNVLYNLGLSTGQWARALEKVGVDTETAYKVAENGGKRAAKAVQGMADANLQAAMHAAVWRDRQNELRKQLADTANNKAYTQFQQKIASLSAETAGKLELEKAILSQLDSTQAKSLATLREQRKAKERANAADAKQAAQLAELRDQYERLNTTEAREIAVLQAQIKERKRHLMTLGEEASATTSVISASERRAQVAKNLLQIFKQRAKVNRELAVTGERLAWGYERLTQAQAELTASQNRAKAAIDQANKAMIEGEQNLHAYTGANLRAAQAVERETRAEKAQAAARKADLAIMREAVEARVKAEDRARAAVTTRTNAETQALSITRRAERGTQAYNAATLRIAESSRAARDSTGAYAKRLELLNRWLKEGASHTAFNRQLANTAAYGRKATESLKLLTPAEAELEAREKALAERIRQRNDYTLAAAGSVSKLSAADADLIARTEALNRSTEKHNKALLEEARAAHGLIEAKNTLDRSQQRELDKLKSLQAQANLLTTDYGRQTAALQRQIQEQKEYNRLLTTSTAELLGFSKASRKTSAQFNASAQAAAMLRAGVTGLHASFGMYTSATILAATATYAFTASLRDAVATGIDFTGNMARAEAIMMSSVEGYRHVGMEMAALESKVRALGATTSYTASEVAQGLVDLGMAGLSSSDAIEALEPALRLASIGMIDMGQSADIATNVMTAFHKSADDLEDVVDVMATAVTNSNTSIQQLANALSYVGPAASSAGFSLRDTVAAVELLSNAGIKASKAGTGLRRFMLNIQNPTAKGKAVLDELGIAITHADGSTRDMMDILSQFKGALYDGMINPAERSQKVMDLVGVRAQSAVSRLIGSAEQFGELRNQLDSVTGAAERMREQIEDFLGGDVKKMRSAFEEVELTAFERMEPVLRRATLEVTAFLQQLNQPIEEGSAISKLDAYIADFFRFGEAALWVAGAIGSWKVLNAASVLTAGFAQNTQKATTALQILTARGLKANTTAHAMNTRAIAAHSMNMQLSTASMIAATGASVGLTRALGMLATAGAWVGTAFSWVARLAGWASVFYLVYQGISAAFGSSTQDKIEEHNDLIEESEARHKSLQGQVERTAQAMKAQSLEMQASAIQENLESLTEMANAYRRTIEATEEGSAANQLAKVRLDELVDQGQAYVDELGNIREALGKMGESHEGVTSLREAQDTLAVQIAQTSDMVDGQREYVQDLTSDLSTLSQLGGANDAMEVMESALAFLEGRFVSLNREVEEATTTLADFVEQANIAFNSGYRDGTASTFADNMTTAQGMSHIKARRAELMNTLELMEEATKAGQDFYRAFEGGPEIKFGSEHIKAAEQELYELGERRAELEAEQRDHADALNDVLRERNELQMTESQLLRHKQQQLTQLRAEEKEGYGNDLEAYTDNIKQQNQLVSDIDRLKESLSEGLDKRSLDSLLEQFQRLLESGDDVAAATAKFKDQLKMVDTLLAAGQITQDDYNTALDIMRDKFWDTVGGADALLGTLQELNEAWEDGGGLGLAGKGGLFRRMQVAESLSRSEDPVEAYRGQLLGRRVATEEDEFSSGLVPGFESGPGSSGSVFADADQTAYDMQSMQDEADNNIFELQIAQFEAMQQEKYDLAEKYGQMIQDVQVKKAVRTAEMEREVDRQRLDAYGQTATMIAGLTQQGLDIVKYAAGESSEAYKVMFLANKAASIAQAIVNTELGATKALSVDPTGALSTITRALGYTSIGIMAGQALTQTFSGGGGGGGESSSAGGSSFSGMYDKGGQIPAGQYGIVGEYGPEIVHGPANVTSRKDTAKQLGGGGDHIEFKPVIQVTVEGGGQGDDPRQAEEMGKAVGKQVEAQVMQLFHREMRPNGVLDRWKRS